MKPRLSLIAYILLGAFALGADAKSSASAPPPVSRGAVYQSASGTKLKILMDQEMFRGAELEIGDIMFI